MIENQGDDDGGLSRRAVLRGAGVGIVGAGLAGTGAATDGGDGDGERLVVGTEAGISAQVATRRANAVEAELDFGDLGRAVVGEFTPEAVADLESSSHVRYVERDVEVHTLPAPAATLRPADEETPWGIDRVGVREAHERGYTGAGANIAVVDTGIDSDHPDLATNVGEGYAPEECSGRCDNDWDDDQNHGTHCAGIAAAVDNARGVVGVGAGATLHAVKVLDDEGSGSGTGVAAGIKWAADQGHDVVSMSLGATRGISVLHDAVKYAVEAGCLVVAAGGNEGPCRDCVHYPGAYPEAIAVGSIDRYDDRSEFSSTGDEIEIVAPGTDVLSTVVGGDYRAYSGTSMATPHVAGAGALLMAAGLSAEEARARLTETAEDIGLDDRESGAGLLDVLAAVDGVGSGGLAVTTGDPTDVGRTSVTLAGELTGLGEYDGATVGFEYAVAGDGGEPTRVEADEVTEPGAFEAAIDGLAESTAYEVTAFAEAGDGTRADGATRRVLTAGPLSVATADPASVGPASATLQGELVAIDAYDEVAVGFDYWVAGDREDATAVAAGTATAPGAFDVAIDDLDRGTTYEVVAIAAAGDGTRTEGAVQSFTTVEGLAVTTGEARDVGSTTARLSGDLVNVGDVDAAEVGFEYWVEGERDDSRTVAVDELRRTGGFEGAVRGLDAGTTHAFVARAAPEGEDLADGVAGATRTFTTGEPSDGPFEIVTNDPDWIFDSAAKLVGEVTRLDRGVGEIETSFQYWEKGAKGATERWDDAEDVDEPDDFDEMVWVEPGTTYVAVAHGVTEDGRTATGQPVEFTTEE